MTIQLRSAIFIAGVHQAVGTSLTLDAALEADLVNRGDAVYTLKILPQSEVGVVNTPHNFAELPTPSAENAGLRVWCTDYPGPQGGCLLISTGSRWRPDSQQHCLMNYHNGATGLVVASGAAEALFGVARLIKGGMLKPGDRLRMNGDIIQAAASSAGLRALRVRSASTEEGLLAGGAAQVFVTNSTSAYAHTIDRNGVILTDTAGKSSSGGFASGVTTGTAMAYNVFSDLSADGYLQFTAANASDQVMTIWSAAMFVEYGS